MKQLNFGFLMRYSKQFSAFFLGGVLTFAFAPYSLFPLAILSILGLLFLWQSATPRQAFWLGFCFGMGLFGLGIYWIITAIYVIGEVPLWLSLIITLGLMAIMSLFPALCGFLLKRFFSKPIAVTVILAFPALWTLLEWFRSFAYTGFPWLFLGYSQTYLSPLRGYATIFSVYGVTYAVCLTAAMLFLIRLYLKDKKYNYAATFFLAILALWIVGYFLTLKQWTKPIAQPIQVALVQGNIPQVIKWSPEHLQLSLKTYVDLTKPLWGNYELIIWPETAIPVPLQKVEEFVNSLDDQARASGSLLITGIPIEKEEGEDGFYNAIVTLGKERKVYLKRHLIPFGESTPYLPFLELAFNFMQIPMSNLFPGRMDQRPLLFENIKILGSICYEITFPELSRTTDETIGLLLTVTNDGWYGRSNAQAQHLEMAAMRSIEMQRPLIFASNDGISAIIGPDGVIEKRAPAYQAYVLKGSVQPLNGLTPWMKYGADCILSIICCSLYMAYMFCFLHFKSLAALEKAEEDNQVIPTQD